MQYTIIYINPVSIYSNWCNPGDLKYSNKNWIYFHLYLIFFVLLLCIVHHHVSLSFLFKHPTFILQSSFRLILQTLDFLQPTTSPSQKEMLRLWRKFEEKEWINRGRNPWTKTISCPGPTSMVAIWKRLFTKDSNSIQDQPKWWRAEENWSIKNWWKDGKIQSKTNLNGGELERIRSKECDGGKFVKRTIKSRTNLNGGELDMIDGKKRIQSKTNWRKLVLKG